MKPERKRRKPLLCRIGLHKPIGSTIFEPSISAKIVSGYWVYYSCKHCGKVIKDVRYKWDGEDFHEVKKHDVRANA